MVADRAVDFIFSFDSLVHAEEPILKAYVGEIAKKLRPNGAAFLHHSNAGEYIHRAGVQSRLSRHPKMLRLLKRLGVWDDVDQWRAPGVTAEKMAMLAQEHNLQCVSQELVTWGTRFALIDCLSTLVPPGSQWSRERRILRNRGFGLEAMRLSELSRLYAWSRVTHWN
jgi:hypothetical protein